MKGSVRLSGPQGAQPGQLADAVLWPGTDSVKSATLAFVVDELAPLATNIYAVTYGPAVAAEPAPATDLSVRAHGR